MKRNKKNYQAKKPSAGHRIPRPTGITQMVKSLNLSPTRKKHKQLKERIQNKILYDYINNGYTICGKPYSLQELSVYLQIPTNKLQQRINDRLKDLQIIDIDNLENLSRALYNLALKGALVAQRTAEKQASVLAKNQGEKYVPFLSSALNTAISNQIGANKPLIDLLTKLVPSISAGTGPTININNQNQQANITTEDGKLLGTNEAVKLIDQSRGGLDLLSSPEAKEALFAKHIAEDAEEVEVVATKQQGFNMKDLGGSKPKPKRIVEHTDHRGEHDIESD